MTNGKNGSAIFGRASRELAGSAERTTAPAIAEMTPDEIAQVAGGTEQQQAHL